MESWSSVRVRVRRSRRPAVLSPLPNYYLVIFLSECSVNALHRNTAKRSGWFIIAIKKFRIMGALNLAKQHNSKYRVYRLSSVTIGEGKEEEEIFLHISLRRQKSRRVDPTTTALPLNSLVSGNEGTAAKTSRLHGSERASRSRDHYYEAERSVPMPIQPHDFLPLQSANS